MSVLYRVVCSELTGLGVHVCSGGRRAEDEERGPVRWGEGLGQLWGLHMALRDTGRVGPALGPSCMAGWPSAQVGIPHVCPGPVCQPPVSSLLCPPRRSLDFLQQGFAFLQGNSCLRLGKPNSASPSCSATGTPDCSITQRGPGVSSPPGRTPALRPPGKQGQLSSPTLMKSSVCPRPRWELGQHFTLSAQPWAQVQ